MRRRIFVALALIAPLLSACGGGGISDLIESFDDGSSGGGSNGAGNGAMSTAEQADADAVLALVNAERARFQLPPVQRDTAAERAAYDHGVDMDVRRYFDHNSPPPDSTGPAERLNAAGATYGSWGENIAVGQPTPAAVMAAWMDSQGHRENILTGSFTHLGVGVRYGTGTVFWVQDFLTK